MSAVDKIKREAAKLSPDEQFDLFRWWVESDGFKDRQLTALRSEIAVGLKDLKRGRFKDYEEGNLLRLAEEVCHSGQNLRAKYVKKDE